MSGQTPLFPLLGLSRLRMETDGAGVTTLVAGAGCPLACAWCINKALLRRPGEPVTAEQLCERVRIDDLYFRATGGGVCFGGGEPLLHAAFLRRFRALSDGWRILAETSLNVPRPLLEQALGAVDDFIVDIKTADPDAYRRYTGGEAAPAWENLRRLLEAVGPERVTVRVPLIPDYCDEDAQARTAEAARALGVQRLDLFPYVKKTP